MHTFYILYDADVLIQSFVKSLAFITLAQDVLMSDQCTYFILHNFCLLPTKSVYRIYCTIIRTEAMYQQHVKAKWCTECTAQLHKDSMCFAYMGCWWPAYFSRIRGKKLDLFHVFLAPDPSDVRKTIFSLLKSWHCLTTSGLGRERRERESSVCVRTYEWVWWMEERRTNNEKSSWKDQKWKESTHKLILYIARQIFSNQYSVLLKCWITHKKKKGLA